MEDRGTWIDIGSLARDLLAGIERRRAEVGERQFSVQDGAAEEGDLWHADGVSEQSATDAPSQSISPASGEPLESFAFLGRENAKPSSRLETVSVLRSQPEGVRSKTRCNG